MAAKGLKSAPLAEQLEARAKLEHLKAEHGFEEPDRGDLDDPSIRWREGKPDYTVANLVYMLGKTKNHQPGELEFVVEQLVKTWEMEASHKLDLEQWTTIKTGEYSVSANGGKAYENEAATEAGNYNVLLAGCRKDLYDSSRETFSSSHERFRHAFPAGFPWEVLAVSQGPPEVEFTWRHWAAFSGVYQGHKGCGETVEMVGSARVTLDGMKVKSIEVFYEPEPFLEVLEGKRPASDLQKIGLPRSPALAAAAANGGCPFAQRA